jgi:phospholipid/cholesterol/gamma-HCH transport system permease protein
MTDPIRRGAGCRVTIERHGEVVRLVPSGSFDLDHAPAVQREIATAEEAIEGGVNVVLDLRELEHIDGAGAVLLARLLDRIEDRGSEVRLAEGGHPNAALLVGLYRERRSRGA